jgi:hypothetical protein
MCMRPVIDFPFDLQCIHVLQSHLEIFSCINQATWQKEVIWFPVIPRRFKHAKQ